MRSLLENNLQKYQKFVWSALFIVFFASAVFVVAINRLSIAQKAFKELHLPRIAAFLNPGNAELDFAIGNYYFGEGKEYDVDRAEYFYRQALLEDPSYPRARYQLARALFIKGDFYLAEREINAELKEHPDFWRSYYVRALIRGYGGNLFGAAKDFQKFLSHKPESWAAHNDLAWVYFRLGDYQKVSEIASDGLNYTPDNPWLLNSLGVARMNLNDKEGAMAALEKAQSVVLTMTPETWGAAYPGNDPLVYGKGLEAMRSSIKENLALLGVDNGTSTPL